MKATEMQHAGVAEMQYLIQEFLDDGKGSQLVREYLSSIIGDNSLLLIYLKGRKYRVKHAWETLKRNAEVRFNEYPEVFPKMPPEFGYQMLKKGGAGILKARDKFGRRVVCLNLVELNPDKVSMEEFTGASTHFADRLLLDEDAITKGIIFVQNNDGVGWKHVRQYTLPAMLRILNIFWYAYPTRVEALYYLNCPSYARYLNKVIKPFLSEKMKERLVISTHEKGFEYLHDKLPPKILPKAFGGDLENEEAFDSSFIPLKN